MSNVPDASFQPVNYYFTLLFQKTTIVSGYGDSSSSPFSETDLNVDTIEVLSWVEKRVKTGNIFLWGHSLGTG